MARPKQNISKIKGAWRWFDKQGVGVKTGFITTVGGGMFVVTAALVTYIPSVFDVPKLKNQLSESAEEIGRVRDVVRGKEDQIRAKEDQLREKEAQLMAKDQEIGRLEILLTPLRTIGLERFAGSQENAVREMSDYVIGLQKRDIARTTEIIDLQDQILALQKGSGPRTFDFGSRFAFNWALTDAPKESVLVWAGILNAEAVRFAHEIKYALESGGFPVKKDRIDIISVGLPGITMYVKDPDNLPKHCAAIQKAFKKAGFDAPIAFPTDKAVAKVNENRTLWDTDPNLVIILVGDKP